jgi:shikimate kinase
MGAGKSTVGRLAAASLDMPFRDSDALVVAQEACTITELFARHGESYFRDVEERLILEVLQGSCAVLATGGGSVLRDSVRQALYEQSYCVYLQVDVSEQKHRLKGGQGRPLAGDEMHLQRLQGSREPRYRAAAHATVATTGRPAHEVAAEVVRHYRVHGLLLEVP